MSSSRLGKGLDELLPESPDSETGEYRSLPINEVKPNPNQPRETIDRDGLDELVQSIRNQGVVEPILVRPHDGDETEFMIIAGERRWRAAKEVGLETIPGVIRDLNSRKAYVLSLVENIQRENLSPLEEARAYQRLMNEEDMNQEEVAKTVGKSRSSVANRVRLLALPDPIQKALDNGDISAGHARALLGINDKETARDLLGTIIQKSLNVRQTEQLVEEAKITTDDPEDQQEKTKKSSQQRSSSQIARLESELEDSIGAPVTIDSDDRKSGKIIIRFDTPEDFERLRETLSQ